MTGLYLLHFDKPLKHARHYLGFAEDIAARVEQHRRGISGARIIDAAVAAGITFTLVRVWKHCGRKAERRKKAIKGGKYSRPRGRNSRGSRGRLCPLCKIERLQKELTQEKEMLCCA